MLRRPLTRQLAASALLAGSATLGGCESCRHERPYTPFGVTSALPTAQPPASANGVGGAPSPAGSADTSVRKAAFAPPSAHHWMLEGRELEAPPGRIFEQALVADFNADDAREVAAWTLPDAEHADATPGELWLYPSSSEARKLLDYPSFLPTGPGCTPFAALAQSGARSISLDVRLSCSSGLVQRAPVRALAIIDPFSAQAPRFGVRAAEPAPGETLTLSVLARDEDGDGREDYRLSAGLSTGPGAPEIAAELVFLDRAAGISRDGREPLRSLLELAKKDAPRALKKKTAEQALTHVADTRRLLASLCAEGATPRIFDWSGGPLRCGGLQDLTDKLGAIEVSAELALGDVGAALAALSRDGWYFSPMRASVRTQLGKDIEKHANLVTASRVVIGVRPKALKAPAYSPLGFTTGSVLLIQTEGGMFRLAPDSSREEPIDLDAGVQSWGLEVTTSAGARWLGVTYSCDRSELSLLLAGANAEPQVSTLLAPRPGVCGGGAFEAGFTPTPASADQALEALVGGALVGKKAAGSVKPGAARSTNGSRLAISTPLGLFVQAEKSELWKIDGWSAAATSGCVIDDTGRRAACLRAGRAELYIRNDATP